MPVRLGRRVWFAWGCRTADARPWGKVAAALPTILVLSCCRPPLDLIAWDKALTRSGGLPEAAHACMRRYWPDPAMRIRDPLRHRRTRHL